MLTTLSFNEDCYTASLLLCCLLLLLYTVCVVPTEYIGIYSGIPNQ